MRSKVKIRFVPLLAALFLLPLQANAQSLEWVDLDQGLRSRILHSRVYLETLQTVYGYFHDFLKDLGHASAAKEIRIRHLETKRVEALEEPIVTFLVFITSMYDEKKILTVHFSEEPAVWKKKIQKALLRDGQGIDKDTRLWVSSVFQSVGSGKTYREMEEAELVSLLEQKGHPESMTGSTR
jgi:hypothetical protein